MADKGLGVITHYYDKIGVAVLEVKNGEVKVGDEIKVTGHGADFSQTVEEMQLEHESVEVAKKGQAVGLKVKEKVHEGTKVYKA